MKKRRVERRVESGEEEEAGKRVESGEEEEGGEVGGEQRRRGWRAAKKRRVERKVERGGWKEEAEKRRETSVVEERYEM